MKPAGSVPYQQEPATGSYPEPDESSPQLPNALFPLWYILILILQSHLFLCLPRGLFPSRFPTKILYAFLISPISATCVAHFR
jgi:hypothetical protein